MFCIQKFSQSGSIESFETPEATIQSRQTSTSFSQPSQGRAALTQTQSQINSLEHLRRLEKMYDTIEKNANLMSMTVRKRAHFLLDKHCIISLQLLQRQQSQQGSFLANRCASNLHSSRQFLCKNLSKHYIDVILVESF